MVVSNRGPLSFSLDEAGRPTLVGSAGGLAAALQPLFEGSGATWVACAMSEADRLASAEGLMTERGDGERPRPFRVPAAARLEAS